MAVVVGLASQIGNQAVAQAKQTRLYLDAPAVSAERASRAGEVASAYSTPGSPASSETLAWLKVSTRPVEVSPPPEGAAKAFASITARDGAGAGGVTLAVALAAGEVMLAQLEGSPTENGDDEDGGAELASTGAVRPQLGGGTRGPETGGPDDPQEEQPGDAGSPPGAGASAYASTQGASVSVGEPSGGPGVVIPVPPPAGDEALDDGSQQAPPTELASAPSDAGTTPAFDSGTDEEAYGLTGPVFDAGQEPTSLASETLGDEDYGAEQLLPEESVSTSEQDTREGELARAEPTVEDTGPTSDEGAELALVPVSPPAAQDPEPAADPTPATPPADGGGSETAYAEPSPSPEEAPGDYAETNTETNTRERASTKVLVAEADEERVEIVIGGDEAQPVENPSGDEAPPEEVPPPGVPPGREEAGEDASQDQSSADEEIPPEVAPGAPPEDALQTSPEGQQPGVDEQPEDLEDAAVPSPGNRTSEDRQERGQDEQREQDLRQDGPPRGEDRQPEADLVNPAQEVERNDGGGGTVQAEVQGPAASAAENGGATREEQTAVIEQGGSPNGEGLPELPPAPDAQTTAPEPPPRTAPRTAEEPVAAEPAPQSTRAPAQATAGEPAVQQYGEPVRQASARQYEPASQPATVAPASRTAVSAAPETAVVERTPVSGAAPRRTLVEPNTNQRGGEENR